MSVLIEGSIGLGIGIFVGYLSKPIFSICIQYTGKLAFMYGKKKIYFKKINNAIDERNYHRFSKYMYRLEKLDDKFDTSYKKKITKKYNIEDDNIISNKELFIEFCEKLEYSKEKEHKTTPVNTEESVSIISDISM